MEIKNKILSRKSLLEILKRHRREKIVFTNGCFDLLHLGHVKVLEHAKKLGGILVVAVNSDGSVRRLKGPARPLVGEKNRAAVIAALSCVDYVTIFPEDTPLETLRMLRPDILVKGGDYKPSEIVGREEVKKVVRVPLVPGLSTSRLVKRILKAYGSRKKSSAARR